MPSIQFSENPRKRKAEKIFLYGVGGFILFIIFLLIFGLVIKFLWNATIATMFGLPLISYWQAIGLFILAKFFFGFGSGKNYTNKKKHYWKGKSMCAEAGDASTLIDDEAFREYWQEQGKDAYEAFSAAKKEEDESGPGEQNRE